MLEVLLLACFENGGHPSISFAHAFRKMLYYLIEGPLGILGSIIISLIKLMGKKKRLINNDVLNVINF